MEKQTGDGERCSGKATVALAYSILGIPQLLWRALHGTAVSRMATENSDICSSKAAGKVRKKVESNEQIGSLNRERLLTVAFGRTEIFQ